MGNLYHLLYKLPAYRYEDMLQEYEELAVDLYKSGRVRIDTDDKCNFVRLLDHSKNINLTFSSQELEEPLLQKTKSILIKQYGEKSNQVDSSLSNLRDQLKKLQPVSKELSMSLIRLLVQSAHPIVIKWLIIDSVEVFICYSHSIGDVMDIRNWKVSGSNSGMQSTDGKNVAVFVSCGGNPFGKTEDPNATFGDGMPALARLQIIAGQELGHYADIKRDYSGKQIGRHSANFSCTRATYHVRLGRISDIENCQTILSKLDAYGINNLYKYENNLLFYRKNKIYNFDFLYYFLLATFQKYSIILKSSDKNLHFVRFFANKKYMATDILALISDMAFNLAPQADVYSHPNPEIEEAIACVEALARIPQQVMKWGYVTTKSMMPSLYKIYYGEVIPSLIDCYNIIYKTSYKRNYKKVHIPITQKILRSIKNIFSAKENNEP